jgi:hypothetical protein
LVQDAAPEDVRPGELAFRARLVPTADSTLDAAAMRLAAAPAEAAMPDPAASQPAVHARGETGQPHPSVKSTAVEEHAGKTDVPDVPTGAARAAGPAASELAQPVAPPEAAPSNRAPESRRPELPLAAKVDDAAPVREAVNVPAAARDITLQFSGGDSRVQVQVAERAGEVRVAVHTPDTNLAGALREDLPLLAAKLEQAGFRAETWHPAVTGSAEAPHAGEPSTGSPHQDAPDSQKRSAGGQQDEQQQRREAPEAPASGKASRKDFSRLFASLR